MREHFNFAIQSIKHRKVRSVLTVLAVVIGIAAIVSLVTISQGLGNAIEDQFENLGSNRFYIVAKQPGFGAPTTSVLTQNDADAIEGILEIEAVNSYLWQKIDVTYNKEEKYTSVTGTQSEQSIEEVWETQGVSLEKGRWIDKGEDSAVVIGSSLAHKTYEKEIFLNEKIEIKNQKYKVVGIMNSLGNEEDDNNVIMTMDEARIIHEDETGVTFIDVIVKDNYDMLEVSEEVTRRLEKLRGEEDFELFLPEQILEQLGTILLTFQIVLGGIAAISLLVGAVGIMNSMYTNVLERKKEIGILKAIGATPKDIKSIFIIEAGVMGLIGGVLGALIGSLLALGVGLIAEQQGFILLKVEVAPGLVVISIIFAVLIGSLAGYLPAKDAATLLPVEALKE
jgi:putative ABC transport system permease protein